MENYTKDQIVEFELSEKEERRQELENSFQFANYKIVRKELFAHLREPAIVIRRGSITFNTACINAIDEAVYVHIALDEEAKHLAVYACDPDEKDALRWCTAKDNKRKSRKMNGSGFADFIYKLMDWDKACRYKVLGYRLMIDQTPVFVFDLNFAETFDEKAANEQETAEQKKARRKGYYAGDIANTFGVPVEEHKKAMEEENLTGYVQMSMNVEQPEDEMNNAEADNHNEGIAKDNGTDTNGGLNDGLRFVDG